MSDTPTFRVQHPRRKAIADRVRTLAAGGDPGQPEFEDDAETVKVRFADCEPCVQAAVTSWEAHGTVDWVSLVADGASLVEINADDPGRFVAVLAVEEEQTADSRVIAAGASRWRPPPLPLMLMTKTADGHDGSEVCAVIEQIVRAGDKILGIGRFDTGTAGLEAARLTANKILTGVSIDAGDVEFEIVVTAEDENGVAIDGVARMTALTILGATVVPFPAIGSTIITYVAPGTSLSEEDAARFGSEVVELLAMSAGESISEEVAEAAVAEETVALAAAGPIQFDPALFADPKLAQLTPITVDRETGRVFGHAAAWGQCHISFPGTCVTPPRTRTNYGHFLTGSVHLADGSSQPVGTIALDASHADHKLNARDATLHYDHTGTAAAFVNVGEDAHGIWVSGVLRPDLSENDATILAASSLSGDWRKIGSNLELVALLSVNTPGFPITHSANEQQVSLVAAGFGHIPAGQSVEPVKETIEVTLDPERVAEAVLAAVAPLHEQIARLEAQFAPMRKKWLREELTASFAATTPTAAIEVEVIEADKDVAEEVDGTADES